MPSLHELKNYYEEHYGTVITEEEMKAYSLNLIRYIKAILSASKNYEK